LFLCYLYAPNTEVTGDFGDGTKITTHRTQKMCFPMVPFGPSKIDNFRNYYEVQEVDFNALEFEQACNAESVKAVLGSLGQEWAKNSMTTAPMGAILRAAEGIDAVRNLARSGMGNTTGIERGAAIVCGLSQLGGLIFSATAIAVIGLLSICAPLGGFVTIICYRSFNRNRRIRRKRDEVIDEMLIEHRNRNMAAEEQPLFRQMNDSP
jgi:hypothetical protein